MDQGDQSSRCLYLKMATELERVGVWKSGLDNLCTDVHYFDLFYEGSCPERMKNHLLMAIL